MWRRGYDGWAWFVVGVLMGPLSIAPALARRTTPRHYDAPDDVGLVDVLVGFDGSAESRAAIATATAVFGSRLGRLTLATAVPIDYSAHAARLSRTALDEAAKALAPSASTQLVEGLPSVALAAYASEAGYEVLVVGTRGAGLSKHVLGSVATALSHSSKVPVLLVPAGG